MYVRRNRCVSACPYVRVPGMRHAYRKRGARGTNTRHNCETRMRLSRRTSKISLHVRRSVESVARERDLSPVIRDRAHTRQHLTVDIYLTPHEQSGDVQTTYA